MKRALTFVTLPAWDQFNRVSYQTHSVNSTHELGYELWCETRHTPFSLYSDALLQSRSLEPCLPVHLKIVSSVP